MVARSKTNCHRCGEENTSKDWVGRFALTIYEKFNKMLKVDIGSIYLLPLFVALILVANSRFGRSNKRKINKSQGQNFLRDDRNVGLSMCAGEIIQRLERKLNSSGFDLTTIR